MKKFLPFFFISLFAISSFSQKNLDFQARVAYNQGLSDIWGYTDTLGNEYAIVCLNAGTAIENISNPAMPQNVYTFESPRSSWRDAKTYGHFAYLINESFGGLQIINLENLPNSLDSTDSYFWSPIIPQLGQLNTCHNIYIDVETGYGFLSGCNLNNGGVLIIDLFTTPGQPQFVASAAPVYSHDVYTRGNFIYSSEINAGRFSIQDMTDKSNIFTIATQTTPFTFTHNAWLSDDSSTLFTTDERGNASVAAYDISDVNNIQLLDEFRPIASIDQGLIPHNVHVLNDYLVTSYYTEGVVITDANRPQNLIEVGNYDTFNGGNGFFAGTWGVYPFFESGTVVASDMGNGLYILTPTYIRASYLEGITTDSITGQPLSGVSVSIISDDPNAETSNILGEYKTGQVTPGTFDVVYSKEGYHSKTITVTLETAEVTLENVALSRISTRVTELEGIEALNVYPNPFNESLALQYEFNDLKIGTTLKITDILGRPILTQVITQKSGLIELGNDWESGVYFAQMEANGAISAPIKIVKTDN